MQKTKETYHLKDFIELKNETIALWSEIRIYLYKHVNNEYILLQIIDEIKNIKFKSDFFISLRGKGIQYYRELNSILELNNGNLIACNNMGLNIYRNKGEKYTLESKHFSKIIKDIKYAFEIGSNNLILLQSHNSLGNSCKNLYRNHYSISIYNIETHELTLLDGVSNLEESYT